MNVITDESKVKKAFAGYYLSENKILQSASGGAASAIAEKFIECGGIVYGASYTEDFKTATFFRVIENKDIQRLKGSKYVYVKKVVYKDGEWKRVSTAIKEDLKEYRKVLFIGLGCDVLAVKREIEGIDEGDLYTIELLCDGVTNEIVHQKYIERIELQYKSKVKDFTVRYKKDGWIPLYIYAEFENGRKHIIPFYESDYGYAFVKYKRKGCYWCPIKKKNHHGDIMLGDFWGCTKQMKEYNSNGVSQIFIQASRGEYLYSLINKNEFKTFVIDGEYALEHSPRYYIAHEYNEKWNEFDKNIKNGGLAYAVIKDIGSALEQSNMDYKKVVLWGTGSCYHKMLPYIRDLIEIDYVVDKNKDKWNKTVEYGYVCKSPDEVINNDETFVIIMMENKDVIETVVEELKTKGICKFDTVHNWIKRYCVQKGL